MSPRLAVQGPCVKQSKCFTSESVPMVAVLGDRATLAAGTQWQSRKAQSPPCPASPALIQLKTPLCTRPPALP